MSPITLAVCLPLVTAGEQSLALNYVSSSADLQTLNMEGGATELEMGNVNGDGHPDFAHVGDHGSPLFNSPQHGVTLWLGDGQGGFSLTQEGDFGYGGVALGDGLMDVGYGIHQNYSGVDVGDQILEVLRGNGTGSDWVAWDDGLATNCETWGMFGTDFADIDGEGVGISTWARPRSARPRVCTSIATTATAPGLRPLDSPAAAPGSSSSSRTSTATGTSMR